MKSIPILLTIVFVFSCTAIQKEEGKPEQLGSNNIAYQWGKVSLECTANDTERFKPRPTVTSRILGLIWTSVFDAWSRYDDKAQWELFLKHVVKDEPFPWDLRDGARGVQLAEKGIESWSKRCWVDIPKI